MNKKVAAFLLGAVVIVTLLLALLPKEQKNDVYDAMETAAMIRLERNNGEKAELSTYNLLFQNGFTKLRLTETKTKVDEDLWSHRITYNYSLAEDDPGRIEFVVGDGWIMIEQTVYEFENAQQWDSFMDTLESEFVKYLPKDTAE